jgi:hypothetical protein
VNVRASRRVMALVGLDELDRLHGDAFRRFTCCVCGRPGRTDADPATVIAQRYRLGTVRVRLAHARCADSQVIDVDQETMDIALLGGMLSKAAVLTYASDPCVRPLLILEPTTEMAERTASGEPANLWMCGLLDRGFTLMRTSGGLPGPGKGWLLQAAPGTARLLAPGDTVAYHGGLDPPPSWLPLVGSASACVVLTGTIGLNAYLGDELTIQDLRRLLNRAAGAAELAGAVVRAQVRRDQAW